MVRYRDPETHPERGEDDASRKQRVSPAERLSAMRVKNAALSGVEAIEGAREVALRQLDTRARSRAELHAVITNRGFSSKVAEEVLDRLSDVGLINDEAFAAMIVRECFAARGLTGPALKEELQSKGIDSAYITQAMSQIDDDDEYERALEIAQRKVRGMNNVEGRKMRGRLLGALARKGYPPSLCRKVISQVLDNEDTQEEQWQ